MKKKYYIYIGIFVVLSILIIVVGNIVENKITNSDYEYSSQNFESVSEVSSVSKKNNEFPKDVSSNEIKNENVNETKTDNIANTTNSTRHNNVQDNASNKNNIKISDKTNSTAKSNIENATTKSTNATTKSTNATTKTSDINTTTTTKKVLKPIPNYTPTDREKAFFELTNKARRENGSPELKWSDEIHGLAYVRLQETLEKWDHERPDGTTFVTVLYEYDIQYKYKRFGENLAKGKDTDEACFNALMNSEGHRRNILNAEFDVCGIAICTGNDGYTYIVQLFGKMP